MSLVILGKSNKEIAKGLGISHRTVEVHRLRIMQKTGTNNSIELLEYNLTERKLLEHKLQESELRFNQFLNALPAIAFIKDEKGNIIFANKYLEETLGVKNWQDSHVKALFTSKVASKMTLDDKRALRAGQLNTEEQVPNFKGEIRLYQTNKFRIPTSNNKNFLGGISIDITDRRIAENALKESLALLAEAQAFAHLGSWWWNTSTGENKWSDEQYRVYGYEPGTIIPSHHFFIKAVVEDDRAKVEQVLTESLEKQTCFEIEYKIRLPDDSIKSILSRGYAHQDVSNNCIVMSGTDLDITKIRLLERQHFESEERYKVLLEDQTELICRFKIDGTVLYVNRAFCNMFGKSHESLIGNSWAPIAHPEDLESIKEKINSLSPNNNVIEITNRVFDASGNIRWMQFINRGFFDSNGKIREIQSVGRDITEKRKHEEIFAKLTSELKDLYDHAPCGYHSLDEQGIIQNINQTELDWLGFKKEEVIGKKRIRDFFTPLSKSKFDENFSNFKKNGYIENLEFELITKSGSVIDVSMNATAIKDESGKYVKSRTVFHNISKLKELQKSLEQKTSEQQMILENDLVGMIKLKDRFFTWVNKAVLDLFGYEYDELVGKSVRIVYPDNDTFESLGKKAYPILNSSKVYRAQVELVKKNGEPIWVSLNGQLLPDDSGESIWMLIDITSSVKNEKKVKSIAYHDILTGLPNRLLISDRLNQLVAHFERKKGILAVCFLDLDEFKPVNDRFGHDAGDKVLIEVAERIKKIIRTNDTVGRLGGDEFIILLTGFESKDDYIVVLNRLIESINQPIKISETDQVIVGASIGVTLFPDDNGGPDILLRHADHAMYQAKASGKNRVSLFDRNGT